MIYIKKIRTKEGKKEVKEQEIKSMEVNHDKIEKAKKGEEFGLKVSEEVGKKWKGGEVYKS